MGCNDLMTVKVVLMSRHVNGKTSEFWFEFLPLPYLFVFFAIRNLIIIFCVFLALLVHISIWRKMEQFVQFKINKRSRLTLGPRSKNAKISSYFSSACSFFFCSIFLLLALSFSPFFSLFPSCSSALAFSLFLFFSIFLPLFLLLLVQRSNKVNVVFN